MKEKLILESFKMMIANSFYHEQVQLSQFALKAIYFVVQKQILPASSTLWVHNSYFLQANRNSRLRAYLGTDAHTMMNILSQSKP